MIRFKAQQFLLELTGENSIANIIKFVSDELGEKPSEIELTHSDGTVIFNDKDLSRYKPSEGLKEGESTVVHILGCVIRYVRMRLIFWLSNFTE